MAAADRMAIESGVPGYDLMRNAGRAVAEAAADLHADQNRAGPVVVVAGGGNNGGDGFVAARVLAEAGLPVRVMTTAVPEARKGDACRAAQDWTGATVPADPSALAEASLIVDALFGAGLDRLVAGTSRALIEAMNASGAPIVAVDLPSGINGTTGAIMGAAVRATETVTFFRKKPGHLLMPGRGHCGRLRLADIGIPGRALEVLRPATFENDPDLWRAAFPVPRPEGHKYVRGHAVVVSGGVASTGAARLAGRGALRAGAGLVTLASPSDALAVNAAASTAVMVRAIDTPLALAELLADRRHNACIIGPGAGVGTATRDRVLTVLAASCAAVLDADALTSFAAVPEALFSTLHQQRFPQVILTPHSGEFDRIFSAVSENIELHSKLEKCRRAAHDCNAVVLLKGPDTVVAAPDGRAAIAANAPPWLATAGSGDVLAGVAGGLMAQGMPAFEAACAAVWMHGEAGHEAGPGLIAEDLPEVLPAVFRRLYDVLGVPY
jgi:hydroxyethylthiazole kinase-like uncharacterized protein yjeF